MWSPDGAKIAFTTAIGPDDDGRPVVIDRLGYKSDGAGLNRAKRRHIHVLDVATGTIQQFTSGDWNAGNPAWSPDGTRIAFDANAVAGDEVVRRIFVTPAGGGGAFALTTGRNDAVSPYSTQARLQSIPMSFDEVLAPGYTFSSQVGNSNLKWELSHTTNVGVDAAFLDSRVSASPFPPPFWSIAHIPSGSKCRKPNRICMGLVSSRASRTRSRFAKAAANSRGRFFA